mgnify:CR=1 FL=1
MSDTFSTRSQLEVGGQQYTYCSLPKLGQKFGISHLPYSMKILLENLLRTEDGANITAEHITALGGWDADAEPDTEIQFTPARVIMQDFTGVPCIVDLATMREAVAARWTPGRRLRGTPPPPAVHQPAVPEAPIALSAQEAADFLRVELHTIYHEAECELYLSDGATEFLFDSDATGGAWYGLSLHVTNSLYVRIKQKNANAKEVGYDGIETKAAS